VRDTSNVPGEKILDPVCGMIVSLADARDHGLVMELEGREYAFCGTGCMKTFAKSPSRFRAKVDAWVAANPQAAD
jgi:YHS domain-containing protein